VTSQLIAATEEAGGNVLRLPLDELIIGTIAFLIVLVVLAKLAFPRIAQTLAEREDAIAGGLKRADESQAEAQAILDEYRKQLADARAEAAEIRTQAQAERAAMIEAARSEAAAAAELVTQRAMASLEAERQQLRGELTREVGSLSVSLAEKIVGETLADDARVATTVDRFIADLEAGADSVAVEAPAGGLA
jgi:F-type H+-transporting ATPase subunit b